MSSVKTWFGRSDMQFSDAGIVCGKVQLFPKLFFYDVAGSEPGLCGSLICTDEPPGAEQGTAEITCDYHDAVVDFFPEQYVQDWTAGSADGSPSSLQRVHSLLRPMVYA